MIRSRRAVQVLLLTGIVASGAFAAPLAYNINFTTGSGSPTPTGSFTYDSSLADRAQFSAFLLTGMVSHSTSRLPQTQAEVISDAPWAPASRSSICYPTRRAHARAHPTCCNGEPEASASIFSSRIRETPRAVTPSFFPAISLDQDRQRWDQVHGRSPGTTHPKPPSHPRSSWFWQAVHSCC
jgi:hypothetical protein